MPDCDVPRNAPISIWIANRLLLAYLFRLAVRHEKPLTRLRSERSILFVICYWLFFLSFHFFSILRSLAFVAYVNIYTIVSRSLSILRWLLCFFLISSLYRIKFIDDKQSGAKIIVQHKKMFIHVKLCKKQNRLVHRCANWCTGCLSRSANWNVFFSVRFRFCTWTNTAFYGYATYANTLDERVQNF